jgi:hypothetical protein
MGCTADGLSRRYRGIRATLLKKVENLKRSILGIQDKGGNSMKDYCPDTSTTYLARLGLNCVKEPTAAFEPLILLGQLEASFSQLGKLNALLKNPPMSLPQITTDAAASISGQHTDKIEIKVGVDILGALLSALGGGTLSAGFDFGDSTDLQFVYENVVEDRAEPTDVGKYLTNQPVDTANLALKQFITGDGKLFVVTRVVKSNKFTVQFTNMFGVGVNVTVPPIIGVDGQVSVQVNNDNKSIVSFQGTQMLGFGFECYKLIVTGGQVTTMQIEGAGDVVAMIATGQKPKREQLPKPSILKPDYLISFVEPASVQTDAAGRG